MAPLPAAAAAGIVKTKMFKRPPAATMARLWKELKSNNRKFITTTPTNNNLVPNNQALLREYFIELYDGKKGALPYPVVEVYLQFVCEHVNEKNNRNAAGQIPVCAVKDARLFKNLHDEYVNGYETKEYGTSFSDKLTRDGLDPESFLQVRHLFLIDRSIVGHMALIVISPQARTVELLDSDMDRDDDRLGLVFCLLAGHLGCLFRPNEWRTRQGYSPKQGNTPDCTIYVMTSAMLIAFGYPIEYSRSDMPNRRYRIAADLLNGENGMFCTPVPGTEVLADQEQYHYELGDYWTGSNANASTRGFEPLSRRMLSYLTPEVRDQD